MPVSVKKADGGYRVSTPHGTKAKHASLRNAMAQKRLLNAVEHGFKPTGKPAQKSSHMMAEKEMPMRKMAMKMRSMKHKA